MITRSEAYFTTIIYILTPVQTNESSNYLIKKLKGVDEVVGVS